MPLFNVSILSHFSTILGVSIKCHDKTTAWDLHGGGDVVYLDRQQVQCSQQEVLSYFHLQRNRERDRVRYEYKCCSIKWTTTWHEFTLSVFSALCVKFWQFFLCYKKIRHMKNVNLFVFYAICFCRGRSLVIKNRRAGMFDNRLRFLVCYIHSFSKFCVVNASPF